MLSETLPGRFVHGTKVTDGRNPEVASRRNEPFLASVRASAARIRTSRSLLSTCRGPAGAAPSIGRRSSSSLRRFLGFPVRQNVSQNRAIRRRQSRSRMRHSRRHACHPVDAREIPAASDSCVGPPHRGQPLSDNLRCVRWGRPKQVGQAPQVHQVDVMASRDPAGDGPLFVQIAI